MSLSNEFWLYGFEDLTPFFAAVPLKDAYTRFIRRFCGFSTCAYCVNRSPRTGRALPALPNPKMSAPDGESSQKSMNSRVQQPPDDQGGFLNEPAVPRLDQDARIAVR